MAAMEGVDMQQAGSARTPAHLWIVGVLSLLWNSIGAVDYAMSRSRNTDYLAQMMPGADPNAFLAYMDSFPMWVSAGWGLGVWGAFIGSILLLMRSRWAVLAFGLSLAGAIVSIGYQLLRGPPPGMPTGGFAAIVPYIIIGIAAVLYFYTLRQRSNGVLR